MHKFSYFWSKSLDGKFENVTQSTHYGGGLEHRLAHIRLRSHGLDTLSTTGLFQVVNKLVASSWSKLVIHSLLQVVSTRCNKYANDRLQQA